jgi:hypothetical protein
MPSPDHESTDSISLRRLIWWPLNAKVERFLVVLTLAVYISGLTVGSIIWLLRWAGVS